MSDLEEASRKLEASRAKYEEIVIRKNQVDSAYYEERRSRLAEVEADLRAKYEDAITELHRLLNEARAELDRDTYAAAALGFEGHPLKPGTKMVQWDISTQLGAPKTWFRTGKVGVMEVFGPDSAFRGIYCGLGIGDLCLRVFKKDGTPSQTALRYYGGSLPFGWYPEGVDPNRKEEIL